MSESAEAMNMFDQSIGERWKALVTEKAALEQSIAPQLEAVRAAIEPRASELDGQIEAIEETYGEILECEFCPRVETLDTMSSTNDGWACSACIEAWAAAYAACDHDWQNGACTKCGGEHPDGDAL
jgi:hypothetical protein